jgi:hypothetical protein
MISDKPLREFYSDSFAKYQVVIPIHKKAFGSISPLGIHKTTMHLRVYEETVSIS